MMSTTSWSNALPTPTVTAVLLFCDKLYAQKANDRTEGRSAEAQMISPEIYDHLSNSEIYTAYLRARRSQERSVDRIS